MAMASCFLRTSQDTVLARVVQNPLESKLTVSRYSNLNCVRILLPHFLSLFRLSFLAFGLAQFPDLKLQHFLIWAICLGMTVAIHTSKAATLKARAIEAISMVMFIE